MITENYNEPEGNITTWAGGQIIATKPVIYGTTVYSVDGEPVSEYSQVDTNTYEATDYLTGIIHQNLSKGDAQRLAQQIAKAHDYDLKAVN